MYRQLNSKIPGNPNRVRRALPNCVVAGVRGLVNGGPRVGYSNADSEPHVAAESEEDEENVDPMANTNSKATDKRVKMTGDDM